MLTTSKHESLKTLKTFMECILLSKKVSKKLSKKLDIASDLVPYGLVNSVEENTK